MNLPFQQVQQAAVQAPVAPAAGYNPFASTASAKTFGAGLPRLNHGDYIVQIDSKTNEGGKFLITEYTVVEATSIDGNPPSPPGTKASSTQMLTNNESGSYIAIQTLAELGYPATGPEAERAKPFLPAILMAETTKAPQPGPDGNPVAPGALVGRKVRLICQPNLDNNGQPKLARNGKYYPKENWFPAP